jgi:hypothetical protein
MPSSASLTTRVFCSLALAAVTAACAGSTPPPRSPSAPGAGITAPQIEAAQRAWCDALLEIGRAHATGSAKAVADRVLATAYAYDRGTVLFKPTLTHSEHTFRLTKAGALAYFVGGDPAFPDDQGFALKPWVKCTPVIAGTFASGDTAIAMGNVYLEDGQGGKVMVDKTFGYQRTADGALQIVLHHSSLPYAPPK